VISPLSHNFTIICVHFVSVPYIFAKMMVKNVRKAMLKWMKLMLWTWTQEIWRTLGNMQWGLKLHSDHNIA